MVRGSTNWISVGQTGVLKLDIPVYTIGKGEPAFGITCSVHGDETAGLYIVAQLIERLQEDDLLSGTLHIVPVANPAAQFTGSRVAWSDQKDLNRLAHGRHDGSLTERIGAKLYHFLSSCDFVVNIHEFEMQTPITAVFMNTGNQDIKARTLAGIRVFGPDIIWVIDQEQNSDIQYQTTLDATLAQSGVANFPIETTQLSLLSDSEIDRAADGLLRVAAYLGILKTSNNNPSSISPAFTRQEITSDYAGLWKPNQTLMRTVEIGDEIGNITRLPDFQQEKIVSSASGILVQQRNYQLVGTGTALFSIGHPADNIIAPYL